jgi:ribonuclease HIII
LHYSGESIIAYSSGKIVSSGSKAEAAVRNALITLAGPAASGPIVIGSDETGKGEWLGPLVIAAVALTPKQSAELQAIGVMDSKKIPLTKMRELSNEIHANSTACNIVLIAPATFNRRLAEMRGEGKNLNDLLAWAHSRAISDTYSALKKSDRKDLRIVIDEFSRKKTQDRLSRVLRTESIDVVQRPHAEDEIAVAAASIVAREAREDWIDRTSDSLGIDLRELSVVDVSKRKDCDSLSKKEYVSKMVGGN